MGTCTFILSARRWRGIENSVAASLPQPVNSRFRKRTASEKNKVENNRGRHPQSTLGIHRCECISSYTYTRSGDENMYLLPPGIWVTIITRAFQWLCLCCQQNPEVLLLQLHQGQSSPLLRWQPLLVKKCLLCEILHCKHFPLVFQA